MRRIFLIVAGAVLLAGCTPKYTSPNPPRAVAGNPDAAVVVVEFGDFQCPACALAYQDVKRLKEKFGDKVAWKFYHLPLTNIHPYAFNAALAAECAHDQGKFWEMHDTLFENQKNLSRSDLRSYAEDLDLDMTNYDACFKSRAKSDNVKADIAESTKRNVASTPTFFVNDKEITNWAELEGVIDALLAPAVPTAQPVSE